MGRARRVEDPLGTLVAVPWIAYDAEEDGVAILYEGDLRAPVERAGVEESKYAVTVTLLVRRPPGSFGPVLENAEMVVPIALEQPLGRRHVLDGSAQTRGVRRYERDLRDRPRVPPPAGEPVFWWHDAPRLPGDVVLNEPVRSNAPALDWRSDDPIGKPLTYDETVAAIEAALGEDVTIASDRQTRTGVAATGPLARTRIAGPEEHMWTVGETGYLKLARADFVTAEATATVGVHWSILVETTRGTIEVADDY